MADIVIARGTVRALAIRTGFSICDCTLITTAVSEIARNIVEHAQRGDITIAVVRQGAKCGLQIVATDLGPGINDLRQVMQDGYSTRHAMGIGLPGAKRLMDAFEIASTPGAGTIVTMTKWNT